ncbi:MAG: hypothetical protein ACOVNP_00850 [Flavobacterium sp.]
MSSYLIQRLPVYHFEKQIYVTSISLGKTFTPMFVSPSNATNEAFIKVENNEKFSLGIKKKYTDFDFKIVFNEISNNYGLFYNNMPVYILKEMNDDDSLLLAADQRSAKRVENENIIYSQDDEFHFISTENNTFFQHPISSKEEVQENTKSIEEPKKKGRRSKSNSPKVNETPVVETVVEETSVVEASVVEETPVIETVVVEASVVEASVVEETPVIETVVEETPVLEETVIETPVIETPVIETPIVEETVVEETVIEETVIEESIVETLVIETPIVEETVIETRILKKQNIEYEVTVEDISEEDINKEDEECNICYEKEKKNVIKEENSILSHNEMKSSKEVVNKILKLPFSYQNKVYQTNVYLLSGIVEKNLQKIINENVPSENFIFKENNKNNYGLFIEDKKIYLVNIQHEKYLLLQINQNTLLVQNLQTKKFENIFLNQNVTLGNNKYTLTTIFNGTSLLLIPVNSTKVYDNSYGLHKTVFTPILN